MKDILKESILVFMMLNYKSKKDEKFKKDWDKKYKSLDINTIGEAVVAARTIDAELEVECGSCFLIINFACKPINIPK